MKYFLFLVAPAGLAVLVFLFMIYRQYQFGDVSYADGANSSDQSNAVFYFRLASVILTAALAFYLFWMLSAGVVHFWPLLSKWIPVAIGSAAMLVVIVACIWFTGTSVFNLGIGDVLQVPAWMTLWSIEKFVPPPKDRAAMKLSHEELTEKVYVTYCSLAVPNYVDTIVTHQFEPGSNGGSSAKGRNDFFKLFFTRWSRSEFQRLIADFEADAITKQASRSDQEPKACVIAPAVRQVLFDELSQYLSERLKR